MRVLLRPPILILVLISSMLFAFFIWLASIFLALDQHRAQSLSVAHMVVALQQNTDSHSVQSMIEKIELISGKNSVHLLDTKDILSQLSYLPVSRDFKKIWKGRSILSVDITFGKDQKGDLTYLGPQMESLHSILHNDTSVLLIQDNGKWASMLDSLERLVLRIRTVGGILLTLSLCSVVFLWGYAIRGGSYPETSRMTETPPQKSFWMDSSEKTDSSMSKETSPILLGLVIGVMSGILSLLLVYISHSALYPSWADPLLPFRIPGQERSGRFLWMGIPVLSGVIGCFSGIVARILPT
ncbi:MAG: cell division FtsX domain-containing protein [Leptospirales bacterium]